MIVNEQSPEVKKRAEKIAKGIYISILSEGKYVLLKTSGTSMYPFIKSGDLLRVDPLNKYKIKRGDVLAIDKGDSSDAWFYVHRFMGCVKKDGVRMCLTKGDANGRGFDKPVEFSKVVGKLSAIDRDGLIINLEHPIWDKFLNRHIADLSARHGKGLKIFGPLFDAIIEWRWFFPKARKKMLRIINFIGKEQKKWA